MSNHYENNFIVRIEGGLGAQIVGLSVYFYLKSIGCNTLADISYFDTPLKYAELKENHVTHWDWQIDNYGMTFEAFEWINLSELDPFFENVLSDHKEGIQILNLKNALQSYKTNKVKAFDNYNLLSNKDNGPKEIDTFFTGNPVYIKDGPNKSKLYHLAMKDKNIRSRFTSNSKKWREILHSKGLEISKSIVVHLRRGDYLNIKKFNIISEEKIYNIIRKLPDVLKNVIILSDESENMEFTKKLKKRFDKVYWFNNIDSFNTHMMLRQAAFLICSNSQFSNTAAYLGECFSIIPQKHSSEKDRIFQYENNVTEFALLNN